jgi:hypothetical protein
VQHRLTKGHNSPGMNQKCGRVSRRLGHFSKTDVRFWQDRPSCETYRKNGRIHETSHWSARIQYEGRRERFPLYTPNKAAAATRARDIYLFLLANGWEPALAKYRKPKAVLHEHSGDRKSVQAEQLLGHFSKSDIQGCSFKQAVPPGFASVKILVESGAPRRLRSIVLFAVLLLCIVRGEANQPHLVSRRQCA